MNEREKCWKITCDACKAVGKRRYICAWYFYTQEEAFRRLEILKKREPVGILGALGLYCHGSERKFKVWYHDSFQWVPFGPEGLALREGGEKA